MNISPISFTKAYMANGSKQQAGCKNCEKQPVQNYGEGVFNVAYADMLELGMNESDAYMQARMIEEEILEFPIRHE